MVGSEESHELRSGIDPKHALINYFQKRNDSNGFNSTTTKRHAITSDCQKQNDRSERIQSERHTFNTDDLLKNDCYALDQKYKVRLRRDTRRPYGTHYPLLTKTTIATG